MKQIEWTEYISLSPSNTRSTTFIPTSFNPPFRIQVRYHNMKTFTEAMENAVHTLYNICKSTRKYMVETNACMSMSM